MSSRDDRLILAYLNGSPLRELYAAFGLTRTRIYQILKRCGIKTRNHRIPAEERAKKRVERKTAFEEKQAQKIFGCSAEAVRQICGISSVLGIYAREDDRKNPVISAFLSQRRNAKQRKIEWAFSLPEWWNIWLASGKWALRGPGGYVMGRKGDAGPYSPENVYICSSRQNIRDSYSEVNGIPVRTKHLTRIKQWADTSSHRE